MRKTAILCLLAVMACWTTVSAQVDRNALGLRIGGGTVSGAEISYQVGVSSKNRVEIGLGFGGNNHYNRIGLAATYQWVWNIGHEGFNWFIGPGAGVAFNNGKEDRQDYTALGLGGQIGLGFNFNIPLQLTLDTRPFWDFGDESEFNWGLALGIRYRF